MASFYRIQKSEFERFADRYEVDVFDDAPSVGIFVSPDDWWMYTQHDYNVVVVACDACFGGKLFNPFVAEVFSTFTQAFEYVEHQENVNQEMLEAGGRKRAFEYEVWEIVTGAEPDFEEAYIVIGCTTFDGEMLAVCKTLDKAVDYAQHLVRKHRYITDAEVYKIGKDGSYSKVVTYVLNI